jgi:hypothetical protein
LLEVHYSSPVIVSLSNEDRSKLMINATGRVFVALQVTSFPVPTFLRKYGMELQIKQ